MTDKNYPDLKVIAAFLIKANASQIARMIKEMREHGPERIVGYWNPVRNRAKMETDVKEIFVDGIISQEGIKLILMQLEDTEAVERRWKLIEETLDVLLVPRGLSEEVT